MTTVTRNDGRVSVVRFRVQGEEYLSLAISTGRYPPPLDACTRSEAEIALWILAGKSNAEIAQLRGRSARTIANQVASLLAKLGVGSRRELRAHLSRSITE